MPERLHILLAADSSESQRLCKTLEGLGHTVVGVAATGEAALSMVGAESPHLILLDLDLPDSLQAVARIMSHWPTAILAVGRPDVSAVERLVGAGAIGFLAKPVQTKDLEPAMVIARARFADLLALRKRAAGLRHAVLQQCQVGRAKVVLQQRLQWSEAEAHHKLQRLAQRDGITLEQAAARVIAANECFLALVAPPLGQPRALSEASRKRLCRARGAAVEEATL